MVARLIELLDYSPETGQFRWKVTRNARFARAGDVAGSLDRHGYRQIKIDGRLHLAHRLAWLWKYGEWPEGDLDHINLNADDNRIANLRLATRSENHANRRARVDSKSGLKGVHFEKARGCWIAHIVWRGKRRKIGRFATAEEAYDAYCKAAKEQWGEFARLE